MAGAARAGQGKAGAGTPGPAAGGDGHDTPAPDADGGKARRASRVKGRFTMPREDYALIAVLKARAAATGARPRKNDLLRAGLHALMESGRMELRRALDRLPPSGRKARRGDAD